MVSHPRICSIRLEIVLENCGARFTTLVRLFEPPKRNGSVNVRAYHALTLNLLQSDVTRKGAIQRGAREKQRKRGRGREGGGRGRTLRKGAKINEIRRAIGKTKRAYNYRFLDSAPRHPRPLLRMCSRLADRKREKILFG